MRAFRTALTCALLAGWACPLSAGDLTAGRAKEPDLSRYPVPEV